MPPPMISIRFGTSASSSARRRIHQPLVVVREAGDARRLRAGGDDAVVERHRLDAVLGLDREQVRRHELAAPFDDGDLALLGHAAEAAGQLGDHAVLELAQPLEIDLGLAEREAHVGSFLGVGDHLGGVEQRLRRDAADVEADAAQARVALDQHHLLAEVGGAEGGGVAAGARAQHQDVGVVLGVGVLGGAGAGRDRRRRRGRVRRSRRLRGRAGRRRAWASTAAEAGRPARSGGRRLGFGRRGALGRVQRHDRPSPSTRGRRA